MRIITILLVLFSFNWMYAQDLSNSKKKAEQHISKLEEIAKKAKTVKEQLDAYLAIADNLYWTSEDMAKVQKYSEKIIELCKSNDCGETLKLAKFFISNIKATSEEADFSGMNEFVVPHAQDYDFENDLTKAHFLQSAGIYKVHTGFPEKGKQFLLAAQTIYESKYPYHKALFLNYHFLGVIYGYSNIDSSFYFLNKGVEEADILGKDELKLDLLNTLSNNYSKENNISKAIKAQLELVDISERIGISKFILSRYKVKLADYYLNNNEKDKALALCLAVLKEVENYDGFSTIQYLQIKSYIHEHLAAIYAEKQVFEKALIEVDTALAYINKASLAPFFYFKNQGQKINFHIKLKQYEISEKLLLQFLTDIKGANQQAANVMALLAQNCYLLYTKSDLKPSNIFINDVINLYQKNIGDKKLFTNEYFNIYRLLALFNIYQGNSKLAEQHLITTLNIKDSLAEQQNSILSNKLLVEYQTQEKEQQLEVQALKLRQNAFQRNIFILAILILLGLGWYFWQQNQLLKSKQQIIENQSLELQQLYESKNRFFANIAHELRTPLTLISSPIAHIIQNLSLPSSIQQSLDIVHRNTNYLKQLVNQILDLSKKETDILPLQMHQFLFSDLLKALVADFKPFADYQQIAFQTPNNLDNQIELETDGEKLFIILKNLLSNAFKYTNSGGQVTLAYVDMGERLQVSVQDSGRGISKVDLSNIFKRYFQTSDTNAPIEGGTGIGLAVSKEYIESLGGAINVNSELGKGSTFVITFPKQLNDQVSLATTPLSFINQSTVIQKAVLPIQNTTILATDSASILIVEDNLDICQHLKTILQDNYQLSFAHNGVEALKQLEINTPNLILTDLMMPVMDGFELIEKLKKDEKYQDIPIITLTARSEMTDKLTALRIGVDDYLVKPFHTEELTLRIQYLLDNKEIRELFAKEEEEIASMQSDIETTPTSTPMFSSDDAAWLEELETLVKQRIGDVNFGVNQLPLEMASSPSKVYRMTKRLTGLSPKEYINQIRYTKARKLLEQGAYPSIKRVAYEVGFKDEKHFSRNFKKRFGKYPSEY